MRIEKQGIIYDINFAQYDALVRMYESLEIETLHYIEKLETNSLFKGALSPATHKYLFYQDVVKILETNSLFKGALSLATHKYLFYQDVVKILEEMSLLFADVAKRPEHYVIKEQIAFIYTEKIQYIKSNKKFELHKELVPYYDIFLAALISAKQETMKSF